MWESLLIGAAIAFINVLLPSLIQANEPKRLGFLTTLYITAMGLSTAVASSVAVSYYSSYLLARPGLGVDPCLCGCSCDLAPLILVTIII